MELLRNLLSWQDKLPQSTKVPFQRYRPLCDAERQTIRLSRSAMKRFCLLSLVLLVGCAEKKKAAAPTPPSPPPPAPVIRSQMPPANAELLEHCVVTKEENANTVSCHCLPATTKIDSKTGHMVIVCKKMPTTK